MSRDPRVTFSKILTIRCVFSFLFLYFLSPFSRFLLFTLSLMDWTFSCLVASLKINMSNSLICVINGEKSYLASNLHIITEWILFYHAIGPLSNSSKSGCLILFLPLEIWLLSWLGCLFCAALISHKIDHNQSCWGCQNFKARVYAYYLQFVEFKLQTRHVNK